LKNYFYVAICSNTVHLLLCHSLVRSELCSANLLQYKCATQEKFNTYSLAGSIKISLVILPCERYCAVKRDIQFY